MQESRIAVDNVVNGFMKPMRVMEGRTVSGEGHLNGKNPPPKEASTSVRASILLVFQQ